jgi:ppGpp synthetase/RelA/SpoT-type nucleotidyltranferase
MQIPPSFEIAFESAISTVEDVQRFARPKLELLCRNNSWLFDSRLKTAESALAKIEAEDKRLEELVDLWAAVVVVPTTQDLSKAAEAVSREFDGELKPPRSSNAEAFPYDDLHFIAHLGSKVSKLSMAPAVQSRRFEIQIRTGLQYAWWRATHDQVYKGGPAQIDHGWAVRRAAGQARASLELLDGVLNDLVTTAQLRKGHTPSDDAADNRRIALNWLRLWREEDQPRDVIRFADMSISLLEALGVSLDEVEEVLVSDDSRDVVQRRDITPGQAITIAAIRIAGSFASSRLREANYSIFVTQEMINIEPDLESLSPDVIRGLFNPRGDC